MIQTDRLILRRWKAGDRDAFARLNADERVMEFLPKPLTRAESDMLVDRIEAHFTLHGFGLYAAEVREQGRFIGFIGISAPNFDAPFTPCVEIGWRLDSRLLGAGPGHRGRARAVAEYAFRALGLKELVSFTVPQNLRSRRVMEKIGMVRNESDDFDYPLLPVGHRFRRHVLYRTRSI